MEIKWRSDISPYHIRVISIRLPSKVNKIKAYSLKKIYQYTISTRSAREIFDTHTHIISFTHYQTLFGRETQTQTQTQKQKQVNSVYVQEHLYNINK